MATVRGTVRLEPSGAAARHAAVTIAELGRTTFVDDRGEFVFADVPPGNYHFIAHLDHVPETAASVRVVAGEQRVELRLVLAPVNEQVTVTASGEAEALARAYRSVISVGALQLLEKSTVSLGEALDGQPGVAKRGFGPGAGRPVLRGFDGDRVLVLEDGLRVGGIAAQSGDEAEPVDLLTLERVEVVKGPATLLYGSNAIGGVVNAVSAKDVYQRGFSGYLSSFGGSNGRQAGIGGGVKVGGRELLIFARGGAQKADDYRTPRGSVLNSRAKSGGGGIGGGWFPARGWLVLDYFYDRRRHGLPASSDEVDLESLVERRRSYEVRGGWRAPGGAFDKAEFAVRRSRYRAREFEFESDENRTELESSASNDLIDYRFGVDHRRRGRLAGTVGFSGFRRDYTASGKEAPAPRTAQSSIAAYALERFDGDRFGGQLGARFERTAYHPVAPFMARRFFGSSISASGRFPLWSDGWLVISYQRSFRAPALEELYNRGPHPGLLVFDVGNPNLRSERGHGLDLALRHRTRRVRSEASLFYYRLRDFVFAAPTGQVDAESRLPIVDYAQGDGRYVGAEAWAEVELPRGWWFSGSADYVRAELVRPRRVPLPRIPPMRATMNLGWRHGALSIGASVTLAGPQRRLFENETDTAGYAVFGGDASYVLVHGRAAHVLSLNASNISDVLYRNHLSFVKELAPEMGRNVRLSYALRF